MENLSVCGLNLDIAWKNKNLNFNKIENELQELKADLFVLPEMFSTGFVMKPEEIADRNEETLNWMKKSAKEKNTAICGSVSVAENQQFYNRFYFVEPTGNVQHYDKKHLFSYSGEDEKYAPGKERVIINFKGWRILLQVCYDLRFPVFARNNGDYDVILYVANWPEKRIDAWNTLLKARAIENQAYVFGLNRIGNDGNDLHYPESSTCFFADGMVVSEQKNNLIFAQFNFEDLKKHRETFPFLGDADSFQLL